MASMPTFAGATRWINSPPLSPMQLRGRVVLVNFWTLTCINWLRTVPHVRAWSRGLSRRRAGRGRRTHAGVRLRARHRSGGAGDRHRQIDYPVAVDNDYAVWNAFDNHYWPAVYLLDDDGDRRGHHFGEGGYEQVEGAIQRLLGVERPLRDRSRRRGGSGGRLASPAQPRDLPRDAGPRTSRRRRASTAPPPTSPRPLNHWALGGDWSDPPGARAAASSQADRSPTGSWLETHTSCCPRPAREPVSFRVLLDGAEPGPHHGVDVDESGSGVLREGRMYQLVRASGDVRERTRRGHLLRARRSGLRLHLRVDVRGRRVGTPEMTEPLPSCASRHPSCGLILPWWS